jgi:hypothetical protein
MPAGSVGKSALSSSVGLFKEYIDRRMRLAYAMLDVKLMSVARPFLVCIVLQVESISKQKQ